MEVILLRHAESTANVNPSEYHRRRNVPLSPFGQKQAAELKGDFDLVICSPLRRARQTLSQSGIQYRELIVAPELREIIDFPANLLTDDEDEDSFVESSDSVRDRCCHFIQRLSKVYEPGRQILIISHCMFLRKLTDKFAERPCILQNAQMIPVTFKEQ